SAALHSSMILCAASRRLRSRATEDSVIGCLAYCASTAACLTAVRHLSAPSVQMKNPFLLRLLHAILMEHGASMATFCATPPPKRAATSLRHREGSPRIMRL